jgi:CMP-N,N'-diacetyllegionaminic acid synthase
MIGGKRVLAVIPARGGSKGVLRKNMRTLAGKPLIAWTIEEARRSRYIDRLVLSSEDSEIIAVAREFGCEIPFIRPVELARDETPGIEPVLHAITALPESYDCVVLLQPTSPLRTAEDIDGCLDLCSSRQAPACVSVTESEKSPYWMYTIDADKRMHPLVNVNVDNRNRQDLPKVHALNGAVYAADCQWLMRRRSFLSAETVAYEMPKERSLDIDTEWDLLLCEMRLSVGPRPAS